MSKSRAKGTAAETAVVNYLIAHGFPYAERRALRGSTDKGDIAGVPGWVIEVKSCKQASPGAWLREAEAEAVNANVALFCTWVKKAGKGSPGDWTVTMPIDVFARVLNASLCMNPAGVNPVVMTGAAFVELIA